MSAQRLRMIGNFLMIVGVLAWAPFLTSLAMGGTPSFLPFLAAHLTGVLGGVWFRTRADQLEAIPGEAPLGQRRVFWSKILIYCGILAWAPFLYFKRVLGMDIATAPFLALHLSGVIPGALLRASVEWERYQQKRKQVQTQ